MCKYYHVERDEARQIARYWHEQALMARAECTEVNERIIQNNVCSFPFAYWDGNNWIWSEGGKA